MARVAAHLMVESSTRHREPELRIGFCDDLDNVRVASRSMARKETMMHDIVFTGIRNTSLRLRGNTCERRLSELLVFVALPS